MAELLDRIWRTEAAGMLGALSRRLGDFDLAEEALSDALAEALKRWPDEGVPDSPTGWLVTTGWHKALDRLRRDAVGRRKLAQVAAAPPPELGVDDRLAMVFACCHPDLAEPARVALTLYAASGLGTAEIAAAFLVPLPTMAQRLSRAKRQLRERGIRFEVPQPHEYADRLPAVLAVIYLVFNEGYLSSGRSAQRRELAREGVELACQLAGLLPREPEVAGLAALLELHHARAAARFDSWGASCCSNSRTGGCGTRQRSNGQRCDCGRRCARAGRGRTSCRPASPRYTPWPHRTKPPTGPTCGRCTTGCTRWTSRRSCC